MKEPSIFNDVLGPVMRGPSSSHSAGALRIGRMVKDLMGGNLRRITVEYDPNGALVTTHKSQGTDMGLVGGLLGWEPTDERLKDYEMHLGNSGIEIDVKYVDYGATHANTYKLTMENGEERHTMTALSVGGGMIDVIEIDGSILSLEGDTYECLVFLDGAESATHPSLASATPHLEGEKPFARFSKVTEFSEKDLESICAVEGVLMVRVLHPVLPILKGESDLPFRNCVEMESYNSDLGLSLWELALRYEGARSGLSEEVLFERMMALVAIMKNAVEEGIAGTEYEDRILPPQAPHFQEKKRKKELLQSPLVNEIILAVTAFMEVKSSMGVIVAAPTAGSCGTLPGALIGSSRFLGESDENLAKALFSAGMIGVFIARGATFSAEEAGCMAECGSASGMAAAGLTTMAGGSLAQCLSSASVALQNSFGLICDPIGNRVEAPCLGKNVSAASNALSSSNMALADYEHLIPLDEVIESMSKVGKAMASEHCCTATGGLAITPTSKAIERKLNKIQC
jgi:L-serine dehydratase